MKIFQLLLISVFVFILNIGLYYTSESYRGFLQNIKGEKILKEVNDKYTIKEEEIEKSLEDELNEKIIDNKVEATIELNSKNSLIEKIEFVQNKGEKNIELSNFSENLLDKFYVKFGNTYFTQLEEHSSLMGVTSEYPDKYFEYYNSELTLYFFPTKSYKEVREIFEIESYGTIFSINELDNFGEESFYINLGEGYKDDYIRFIYSKDNNVVGIKVSKNEYNSIKNIIK
ncbi:MAG: hypothetical protein Q9M94_06115 [Candidatus Gracilibacteria bacterium]|nr:hypothetical protein [Candidatus Gracilibacteria bacterium]MDQ7022825.1 hypothetical protein [Candidatus Gracilibacteria bacterium]